MLPSSPLLVAKNRKGSGRIDETHHATMSVQMGAICQDKAAMIRLQLVDRMMKGVATRACP